MSVKRSVKEADDMPEGSVDKPRKTPEAQAADLKFD
jgi:hypothetical protein